MESETLNIRLHWSSAKLCWLRQQASQIIWFLIFSLFIYYRNPLKRTLECLDQYIWSWYWLEIWPQYLFPSFQFTPRIVESNFCEWSRSGGGGLNSPKRSLSQLLCRTLTLFSQQCFLFFTNWTSGTSTSSVKDLTVCDHVSHITCVLWNCIWILFLDFYPTHIWVVIWKLLSMVKNRT